MPPTPLTPILFPSPYFSSYLKITLQKKGLLPHRKKAQQIKSKKAHVSENMGDVNKQQTNEKEIIISLTCSKSKVITEH